MIDATGARYNVVVDTSAQIQSLTLDSAKVTLLNSAVLNVAGALEIDKGKVSLENYGSAQSLTMGSEKAAFIEDQGLQFSVAGAFDIHGGTASIDGTFSTQSLTMDNAGATLNMFDGDLTVTGAFEIDKGTVSVDDSDWAAQSLTLDSSQASFTETSDSVVDIAGALTINKGSVTLAGSNNTVGSITIHGGGSLYTDGAKGNGLVTITSGGKLFGASANNIAVSGNVFIGPAIEMGAHFTFAPDTDNLIHFQGEGGSATLYGGVASSEIGPNLISIQGFQLIADSIDAVTMLNKAQAIDVFYGAGLGINSSTDEQTFSGDVSGRGSLSFGGSKTISLSGHNETTGDVTVNDVTINEKRSDFFHTNAAIDADFATFLQHAGTNTFTNLEVKDTIKFGIITTASEQNAVETVNAGLTLSGDSSFVFVQKPFGAEDAGATIAFDLSSVAGLAHVYDVEIRDVTLRSDSAYKANFSTFLADSQDVAINAGGVLDITGHGTTIGTLSGKGEILNTGSAELLTIYATDGVNSFSGTIKGDFNLSVIGCDFTGATLDLQPDNVFTLGYGDTNLSNTHFTAAQANLTLSNGRLIVDHAFGGNIGGFSSAATIDISDETFDGGTPTIKYTENGAGTGGELTVIDGSQAAIHLQLVGNYTASDFSVANDHGYLSIQVTTSGDGEHAVSPMQIAHIVDALV
ncbi:MAG TPA: hypothetical protein VGG10_21575 [Rhizomicrobium sp.]